VARCHAFDFPFVAELSPLAEIFIDSMKVLAKPLAKTK
jgi:hypothetical protein